MVAYVLAQGGDRAWIGPAVRAVLFTALGVTLIIVGIRRRIARARWDREDFPRLLYADGPTPSEDDRPFNPLPGGTWFIVGGSVLVMFGFLHILDLVATLHVSGLI